MLQKMRDQTESLAFKVLVGLVVLAMAVFGFGAFNLFVTGEPEVASINGDGISQSELATATERQRRRMAAQMGENFDPSQIDPVRLQGQVLEQLISRRLLEQAADDLGVAVSRARVDDMLVSNPTFQVDGKFQSNLYRQAVQAMGYTPQGFIGETTRLMALQQLQSSISQSAFLTPAELNLHARLLGERRDVAFLPFGVDRFRGQVTVKDDEVRQRYDDNQQAYMTDESVDAAYVTLTPDILMKDPSIKISEDDVRSAYEADREAASNAEEREARHILLKTGSERTPEQAQKALQAIKARVEKGESFADIAKQVSEDAGSAAQGGELGFVGKDAGLAPPFEAALFALKKPGDISDPVKTEFGYHLIQLEQIRTREYPSFEAAREGVEQRLRQDKASALYSERLRELDNLAFENAQSLDTIVDQLGLVKKTVKGVTRDHGPAPFDNPQVRERLFSTDVLEKGFNSAAVEYGDKQAIVMRVTDRHQPEQIPFEKVSAKIRKDIETERAKALAQDAFEKARDSLEGGASAADVAAGAGADWKTFELVRRNAADVPAEILRQAFDLPRPGKDGKSIGSASLPGGGTALITVTRVQDGQVDTLTEAELKGMRTFLANRVSRLDFAGFFETLRAEATIKRADDS